MNPLKLQIVIDAQNKINGVMKEVSGQIGDLNTHLQNLAPAFSKMQAVGTVAFGAVAGAVGLSVNSFIEAERSTRQLQHAVIDISKGTQDQVDSILAVSSALQKKSGIDGDALAMGAAQLSTFGLQTQSVLDLTKSLADLTVNQSGLSAGADDYVGSANVMAKALQGQFGILEKSGIRFTEAQQNLILYGTETQKVAALTEGLNQNLRETTDTVGKAAEGTFAKFTQSIGDISEAVGGAFLPTIQQVVEKVIPVVQQISEWAAQNPKLVAGILAAVAAAGLIVAAIGTIGLILPSVIAGFGMLASVAGLVGAAFAIMTGPIGIVIAIIAALIAAGIAIYKHWDQLKAIAQKVWGDISGAVSDAWDSIMGKIGTAIETVKGMFAYFVQIFQEGDYLNDNLQYFPEFFQKIMLLFRDVSAAVSAAFETIKQTIMNGLIAAGQIVQAGFDGIIGIINTVAQTIQAAFWVMVNFMIGAWKMLLDFLFPGWEQALVDIFNKSVEVFTALTTFLSETFTRIKDAVVLGLQAISDAMTAAWNSIKSAAEAIWATIVAVFTQIYNYMVQIFEVMKAEVDMAIRAIADVWAIVWGEISAVTVAIFEYIKGVVVNAFNYILHTVIVPVLTAIKAAWDLVWNTIRDTFLSIWDAIKSAATTALDSIKAGVDALMAPLQKLIDLAKAAASAAKAVLGAAGSAVSSAVSAGRAITGRAIGGPVGTDGPHMVGENGPELFWPSSAGRIIPNGAGGGGLSITITGNTFMGQEGIAEQIGDRILDIVKKNIKM